MGMPLKSRSKYVFTVAVILSHFIQNMEGFLFFLRLLSRSREFMLEVHFPGDILVGAIIGCYAISLLCLSLWEI